MERSMKLCGTFFVLVVCIHAQQAATEALAERALQEFRGGKYSEAERDFRELTKVDPSNLNAHAYLGHSLFRQEKFAEAAGTYEKTHELEIRGQKLPQNEHRVLVDQLVMSYGIGGQLKKAHALLDE